jgi:hypothetical protein
MERENLTGDGKGKGASGSNREAESTDASRTAHLAALGSVLPQERVEHGAALVRQMVSRCTNDLAPILAPPVLVMFPAESK